MFPLGSLTKSRRQTFAHFERYAVTAVIDLFFIIQSFDDPRGIARGDTVCGNRSADDASRADGGIVADGRAFQNYAVAADKHVLSYRHGLYPHIQMGRLQP